LKDEGKVLFQGFGKSASTGGIEIPHHGEIRTGKYRTIDGLLPYPDWLFLKGRAGFSSEFSLTQCQRGGKKS
jgi:hypothetical protein